MYSTLYEALLATSEGCGTRHVHVHSACHVGHSPAVWVMDRSACTPASAQHGHSHICWLKLRAYAFAALRHQKDVVACGHLDLLVSASAVQD